MDFIVWMVAEMPSWPRDVDVDNIRRRADHPVVDWRTVAEASADAVAARAKGWSRVQWDAHGWRVGLCGADLFAWRELMDDPIEIVAEGTQRQAGRHRAALISAAGARGVAVVDPDWRP
jgi:hypothetical protein